MMSGLSRVKGRLYCSAVIVAAGRSTRMGEDKMKMLLCGIPVLARTLMSFEESPVIDEIVLVTALDSIESAADLCHRYGIYKASKVLPGGETRTHSALIGLTEIDPRARLAAIHDGARPLVTAEIISGAVAGAAVSGAAAPAIPVRDTIKQAYSGYVLRTPDRSSLMAVQTPQVFEPDLIKAALAAAIRDGISVTDDCSAAELLGVSVYLTEGSEENIKLTTPLDLAVAELVLKRRIGEQRRITYETAN